MPVQIKICGVTNVADAVDAARLGADYIGLNFYPPSPRCVTEGTARLIVQALPKSVTPVGLFVNESWEHIGDVATRLGITMVQVHGDELTPCPIPKLLWVPAFPIRNSSSFVAIRKLLAAAGSNLPTAVLVDAHVPGVYGGTGQTAPWPLLAEIPACGLSPSHYFLAGGLTPDNIAEALRTVFPRPWGVDVASGVEASPGKKDVEKMRRFIENARSAV